MRLLGRVASCGLHHFRETASQNAVSWKAYVPWALVNALRINFPCEKFRHWDLLQSFQKTSARFCQKNITPRRDRLYILYCVFEKENRATSFENSAKGQNPLFDDEEPDLCKIISSVWAHNHKPHAHKPSGRAARRSCHRRIA